MNVHAIFAAAIAPFAPAPMSAAEVDYRAALRHFDWQGDFVDDGQRHRLWRHSLAVLHSLQAEIDPDGEIWLALMPRDESGKPQHGAPLPITSAQREALSVISGSTA